MNKSSEYREWIDDGFINAQGEGNKNRKYELSKKVKVTSAL